MKKIYQIKNFKENFQTINTNTKNINLEYLKIIQTCIFIRTLLMIIIKNIRLNYYKNLKCNFVKKMLYKQLIKERMYKCVYLYLTISQKKI